MNQNNLKIRSLLILIISGFTPWSINADNVVLNETNITIYSTANPGSIPPELYLTPSSKHNLPQVPGYATVRTQKSFTLKEGENRIVSEVADLLDPTTIVVTSLTDPKGTRVIEQSYHFDLAGKNSLLDKYLGQEISVEQYNGSKVVTFNGKLLSADNGLILQDNNGVLVSLNEYSNIRFTNLPEGITVKPTLIWNIESKKAGTHQLEISYRTSGITWWTDYNAIFEEGKEASTGLLTLNAWVSIVNRTGTPFESVSLKLMAGNINRLEAPQPRRMAKAMMAMATGGNESTGFSESPFFEYHLYTLGRQVSLPNNSTKQIELFSAVPKIAVAKQYIYKGAQDMPYYGAINTNKDIAEGNRKVDIYLKFKNSTQEGLGIPLPAGKIRISKLNRTDGSSEFIGEDIINHTAKDEEVLIKMGSAFDVSGLRKQTNFTVDDKRHIMTETFEISVQNSKNQDIEVVIEEPIVRGTNWKIMNNSIPYTKINASAIQFRMNITKESENKLQYTVQYTW